MSLINTIICKERSNTDFFYFRRLKGILAIIRIKKRMGCAVKELKIINGGGSNDLIKEVNVKPK